MNHMILTWYLLAVVPLLLQFVFNALAEIYYATPTCPEGVMSCMTLSQYASQPNEYFALNTTLIMLPGNHSLDLELAITAITFLTISASLPNTMITCSQSARFRFEGIGHVSISGVEFTGCMSNSITSLEQLVIQNCSFDGQYHEGTGLELESVSNAKILNSIFSSNTGEVVYISMFNYTFSAKGGGAIIVNNCEVVTLLNCVFNGNVINSTTTEAFGGAVLVLNSNVRISECTFVKNIASTNSISRIGPIGGGGAVAVADSIITMDNNNFTNNTAYENTGVGDTIDTKVGGAMLVAGSTVTIQGGNFINNTASGSGGAMYVQFDNHVTIENIVFINNIAEKGICGAICIQPGGFTTINTITIRKSAFIKNRSGSNGGCMLMFSFHQSSKLILTDTNFTHNSAAGEGATLYLVSTNLTSNGYLNIQNNGAATGNSYGIALYLSTSIVSLSGTITVSNNIGSVFVKNSNVTLTGNTTFINNSYASSFEGGAITSFQSNLYFLDTVNMFCNEAENGGAILATESKVYMYGNTMIANNRALQSGGGVYAYQTELIIQDWTIIADNMAETNGGGVYAISSIIKVSHCCLHLNENNAERGGGVCLALNAKLYIEKNVCESYNSSNAVCNTNPNTWPRIVYTNNSADYGGAVYVTDDTNSGICSATSSKVQSVTSECFFQVLSLYTQGSNQQNFANLNFTNNTARLAGGTLFGGLIDRCTLSSFAEFFQRAVNQPKNALSYLLNVTDLESFSEISSYPVRMCFCVNGTPDCNFQPPSKFVIKGSFFTVPVVAVDQVNNTVPSSTIHSSLLSGQGRLGEGQAIQQTNSNESCMELQYNAFSPQDNETLLIYAEGPCNNTGISARYINIRFRQCPIGFKPSNQPGENGCTCDPDLSPYITTNCFIDEQTVLREGNFWIAYVNEKDNHGFIAKPQCPFDYCHPATKKVYINFTIPSGSDAQCAFNRTGILCGSCGENLSLSFGTSRCKSCSNNWLALLILFAIAGIALVAFIMVFNLTVAVGTISGLIFYANIITANRAIFFPFDQPIYFFTVFIAWLNLDFGFETCFYDGMDGYAKVWLQLLFPSYIIFLVAMVIVVSEHSKRFSKLLSYTNPVATLATLILLSYAKLLRTIIAALSFTTIQYPDGSVETVWLYDANVPYLKGKHIALFIAALLILFVGLLYTLLLICWQFLSVGEKTRDYFNRIYNMKLRRYLYSFMDVYHAPYNPKHRYWTGLLLLVRGVLYIISAINVLGDPSIDLLCIISVLIALFTWKLAAIRIYKKEYLNNLENMFLANLGIFTAGTLYLRAAGSGNQAALAYTSTSIAFITFLGILCYHMKQIPQYLYARLKEKLTGRYHGYYKKTGNEDDPKQVELLSSVHTPCTYSEVDSIPVRTRDQCIWDDDETTD